MIRTQSNFPVGETPDWERADNDGNAKPLKSISDSFVVLQSLKQSREAWQSRIFPRFSARSRGGKPPGCAPPPHTIQTRGRCDVQIGPHTFPNTTFFEVHYLPISAQTTSLPTAPHLYQTSAANEPSWQATTPYGATLPRSPPAHGTDPQAASSSATPTASLPLSGSSHSSVAVTPSLIAQVNAAAASNPSLANLLQLAATGKANPEQLKSLGLLIHSVKEEGPSEKSQPSPSPGGQTPVTPAASVPPVSARPSYSPLVKAFDLVLEFQENSWERFVFPRGPVVCERVALGGFTAYTTDILITTRIPFHAVSAADGSSKGDQTVDSEDGAKITPPRVVTFRLGKAPPAIWDTIVRWAGGEDGMAKSKEQLESLENPARTYLAHQLADGPLLTQLQGTSTSPFGTKALQPSQLGAARPRRKPALPRKPRTDISPLNAATGTYTSPAKKKKPAQAEGSAPSSTIACRACGSTGVPLILGGRFCRPCVAAGKAIADIPSIGEGRKASASNSADTSRETPSQVNSSNVSAPSSASSPLITHAPAYAPNRDEPNPSHT